MTRVAVECLILSCSRIRRYCGEFISVTVTDLRLILLMPNTHRRRRRDSTVELSRVGGVSASVGSRDPVYNFCCVVQLLRLVTSDDIMTSLL